MVPRAIVLVTRRQRYSVPRTATGPVDERSRPLVAT